MSAFTDKLIQKFKEEPVRILQYPVIAGVLGVLVANDVVDSAQANVWLVVVGVALGVPFTEIMRHQVSPKDKVAARIQNQDNRGGGR